MQSFYRSFSNMRQTTLAGPKSPTVKDSNRVKRNAYTASPVYWFPWNDPFAYKYNMEEMAFDRIFRVHNLSFLVLQSTIIYTETGLYSLGGVTHQFVPESRALFLSEEVGVKIAEYEVGQIQLPWSAAGWIPLRLRRSQPCRLS